MSNNRITPFVKRMRVNGGTIFSFSSAVEDIGLNINERNNEVKISHYALLNIPDVNENNGVDLTPNYFNIRAVNGAWEYEQDSASIKDGRVMISESFQNYALNLESNLLNQTTYNPSLLTTVSERVLWKWLKETGAVRWSSDASSYWTEELDVDGSAGYNSMVKYVGQVSAGNVRQDSFGTFNETYILVPTSHGETRAYFKQVEDENYYHGQSIGDLSEKILGRQDFLQPHPDGLSYDAYYDYVDSSTAVGAYSLTYDASVTSSYASGWWWSQYGINPEISWGADNAYAIDVSSYITSGIHNVDLAYSGGSNNFTYRRSNVDCLSLELDLDNLKDLYNDPTLTFDTMATTYATNDAFDFNAVLIYYTVYNSTLENVLATNLLGIMFLDAPSGNSANIGSNGILLPSLEKIMSTGTGFGTSYSLRLNIKTDNMIDDTGALVVDFATSDQLYAEDFTGVFYELGKAVNILTQNNATISYISDQYTIISSVQTQQENQIVDLRNRLNALNRDVAGPEGTIPMFAGLDADDPLIESSIYMKFEKTGVGTTEPEFYFHVDGSVKVDDITIENAVRDTSGNVILGYGSPLQLGASTNYRAIAMYVGAQTPALFIDTSGNITFDSSLVIFTGDTSFNGIMNVDSLNVNGNPVTGGDSAWDLNGNNMYNTNTGSVGINNPSPIFDFDVSGNINMDGSLFQFGSYVDLSGSIVSEAWGGLSKTDNSIGLGGTLIDGTTTIRKPNNSTYQILKPASGDDGEFQQFIMSNTEFWMHYTSDTAGSGYGLNVQIGAEKSGAGVQSGGGLYMYAQDSSTTVTTSGMTFGVTGHIIVGDVFSVGRAVGMRYDSDYSSKWNALSAAQHARIIPDIEWVHLTIDACAGGTVGPTAYDDIQDVSIAAAGGTGATAYDTAQDGSIAYSFTYDAEQDGSISTLISSAWTLSSGTLIYNGNVGVDRATAASYSLHVGTSADASVYVQGTIYATGEITGISDIRYKENIIPLDDETANKLLSLTPIKYNFKILPNKKRLGFSAQEVEGVFPELVGEQENEHGDVIKDLNMIDMIAPLVATVKKQQKEIDELKSLVQNLIDNK